MREENFKFSNTPVHTSTAVPVGGPVGILAYCTGFLSFGPLLLNTNPILTRWFTPTFTPLFPGSGRMAKMSDGEAIDSALYKLTRSVADRNDGLAEIKGLLSTETSAITERLGDVLGSVLTLLNHPERQRSVSDDDFMLVAVVCSLMSHTSLLSGSTGTRLMPRAQQCLRAMADLCGTRAAKLVPSRPCLDQDHALKTHKLTTINMFATLSAASTQSPGVQMLLSELPSVLRALAAGLAAAPKSCLICLSQLLSADRAAMHAHAELWLPGVVEFVLDELKKARLADAEAARLAAAEATGKNWNAASSSEAKDKSKEAVEAKENQGGAGSSGRRSPVDFHNHPLSAPSATFGLPQPPMAGGGAGGGGTAVGGGEGEGVAGGSDGVHATRSVGVRHGGGGRPELIRAHQSSSELINQAISLLDVAVPLTPSPTPQRTHALCEQVWEVIARTPPGLPEPILLPTPTTSAAREEATARLWGSVAELLGAYLGEPDRRDQLNQYLMLPSAGFGAKEPSDRSPAYAVRAGMFRAWRRLVRAWAPLLVDAQDRSMSEKRLSLLMMPLRDLWKAWESWPAVSGGAGGSGGARGASGLTKVEEAAASCWCSACEALGARAHHSAPSIRLRICSGLMTSDCLPHQVRAPSIRLRIRSGRSLCCRWRRIHTGRCAGRSCRRSSRR